MMTLLLRLGPLLAGLGIYALFQWQWQQPLFFPWPLVLAVVLYATIAVRIAWNQQRSQRFELIWKVVPGCLFVFSAAVCSVMLEVPSWRLGLSILVAFVSYLSLELFFLHQYDSAHYPVNGLTYLSIGLVPLSNAFLAWGLSGVHTFATKYTPFWTPILAFALLDAFGFVATSHPDATPTQRRLWMLFGAWIGVGIGALILFLPLSMPVQACLAALLVAAPIRLRRYGFLPRPSAKMAWGELVVALVFFCGILWLSRWA